MDFFYKTDISLQLKPFSGMKLRKCVQGCRLVNRRPGDEPAALFGVDSKAVLQKKLL